MLVIGEIERGGCVVDDDDASFDAYVAGHQAALVRYATLLCGSPAQAEDLVQEVLIRLYPRWGRLADPHPYVRRSVTNEFLSWKRRWSTRHVQAVPDAALVGESDRIVRREWDPGDLPVDDGPDPELWARLQALPERQRAAVVLRYWEGLSDAEIGDALGCKPVSVRAHVSRGLASLRAGLTEGVRR